MNTEQTTSVFKKAAWAEGVSLLVLLFIAMPLKYIWHIEEPVLYIGWAHGLLFITYCILALMVKIKLKLSFGWLVKAGIMAFLPFGTFIFTKNFPPAGSNGQNVQAQQ